MNKITKRFVVIVVLLCMFCASCKPTTIEPTSTTEPTKQVITETPVPTETPLPTPTPEKEVPNGLLDESEIIQGEYTVAFAFDMFPFHMYEYMENEQKSLFNNMYKESSYTSRGLEIVTGNNDLVLLEKSKIENSIISTSFYLNDEKVATISTSEGTWLEFSSTPTGGNGILWGFYDSTNSTFLSFESFPEETSTFPPFNILRVEIDANWRPKMSTNILDFCKEEFTEIMENKILQSFPQEKLELQKSRVLTYQLPNGKVYRWGPPPMLCPFIEITYP